MEKDDSDVEGSTEDEEETERDGTTIECCGGGISALLIAVPDK